MNGKSLVRVLVYFTIITLIMTYPLIFHFRHALQDRQDPLLNVWIMTWEVHQLLINPLDLYQANIFYPYPNALTYSEILFPNAVLAMPLLLITNNPILVYNLLFWLTFILSAFGVYLLVYYLTGHRGAGFLAGLLLAFSPYRFGHLSQIQLLTMQWIPLTFLSLHQCFGGSGARHIPPFGDKLQCRAPSADKGKWFFLTAFFFVLQALSSFYYAFYLAFGIALYLCVIIAVRFWHCYRTKRESAHLPICPFAHLLICSFAHLLGAALVIIPFVIPYYQTRAAQGIENTLEINERFSASLQAYLYHAPENPIYGRLLAPFAYDYGECCPPDYLFPGIIPLLLTVYALTKRSRTPSLPRAFAHLHTCTFAYLLIAIFAFITSLGPTLHLRALQPVNLPFALPYRFFFDHIPGFTAMRAPVRFASLLTLALAVLAGIGASKWANGQVGKSANRQISKFANGQVGESASLFIISALILIEYIVVPVGTVPVAVGADIPPVYRWLAAQPRTVILELPLAADVPSLPLPESPTPRDRWAATNLLQYQYFSTYHGHTTPDGYSGFIPPRHGEFAYEYEMENFPSERAISLLQGMDVQYLILHRQHYSAADWRRIQTALPDFPDLQFQQSFDDAYVYRVTPHISDHSQLAITAYYPPTAQQGAPYAAYLIVHNRAARSFVVKPTEKLTVRANWGESPEQDVAVQIPLVTSELSIIPVRLTAPRPAGTYQLTLYNRPPGGDSALPPFAISSTVQVGGDPVGATVGGNRRGQPECCPLQPLPVRLARYEIGRATYQPGDTLRVNLYWHALAKVDAYYSLFLRLVAPDGNIVARWDGQPQDGAAPTFHWRPATIITDTHKLTISPAAPPGAYHLELGFYNPTDLSPRLILNDAEQFVPQLLIPITISLEEGDINIR